MPDDDNVARGVLSFLEWETAHKVKFLWTEQLVYSKEFGYVGTADFAAMVDDKKCLCDIKTGNGLYNSVMMQTAAYQKAIEEESKFGAPPSQWEHFDGRWAIRIAKETEEEYLARMAVKNEIKEVLGKDAREIKPYEIFEAVFLDKVPGKVDADFKAFLALQTAYEWDKENKLW
jgi:hypothetical protein